MQKKQAKVFAGLLSMSLAVSLMTPVARCFLSSSKKKNCTVQKECYDDSGTEEDNSYQKRKRKAYQMEY